MQNLSSTSSFKQLMVNLFVIATSLTVYGQDVSNCSPISTDLNSSQFAISFDEPSCGCVEGPNSASDCVLVQIDLTSQMGGQDFIHDCLGLIMSTNDNGLDGNHTEDNIDIYNPQTCEEYPENHAGEPDFYTLWNDEFPPGGTFKVLICPGDQGGNGFDFIEYYPSDLCTYEVLETCKNNVLHFDGDDDGVSVSPFPIPDTNSNFSLMMNFQSEGTSSTYNPGCNSQISLFQIGGQSEGGIGQRFHVGACSDGYLTVTWDAGPTSAVEVHLDVLINDGNWHDIRIFRDSSQLDVFLDCENVYSTSNFMDYMGSTSLVIGDHAQDHAWDGSLDNVSFWNYASYNMYGDLEFSGAEPGLVFYYDFEEGIPGGDNTSLTNVMDKSPNNNHGTIQNLGLMGDFSSFVCMDSIDMIHCGTPDSCLVDTLIISTGYHPILDTLIAIGEQQSFWLVDSVPSDTISLPYPAWTISSHSDWEDSTSSRWISVFNTNLLNANNDPPQAPYSYKRCFCVAEDSSAVDIQFNILADDIVSVYLEDETHTRIAKLIELGEPVSYPHYFQQNRQVDTTVILDEGEYCLRANVRNTESVAMGLNIEGFVTGAQFIEYDCCAISYGQITGIKYHDYNCNGYLDEEESAEGIPGWAIILCDTSGMALDTAITDALGTYHFRDLIPGNYIVKEVLQSDWEQITPVNGMHEVSVKAFEVVTRNFGNKYTGPIATSDIGHICLEVGTSLELEWIGQECDCEIKIFTKPCNENAPRTLIATVENTGEYSWMSTAAYVGQYSFELEDCEGNVVPFKGCVDIGDYGVDIVATQLDCGSYEFHAVCTGFDKSDIASYQWEVSPFLTTSDSSFIYTFGENGSYDVTLSISTMDNCTVDDMITLNVKDVGEEDCCEVDVKAEIEGDLYIHDFCHGVILTSPNGSCFRVTIDDAGGFKVVSVVCP